VELLALSLRICIVSHFSTLTEKGGVERSGQEGVVLPGNPRDGGAGLLGLSSYCQQTRN
jgi:hypothetical protein